MGVINPDLYLFRTFQVKNVLNIIIPSDYLKMTKIGVYKNYIKSPHVNVLFFFFNIMEILYLKFFKKEHF